MTVEYPEIDDAAVIGIKSAEQRLKDEIYELQNQLDRSKKLLGQCMERQVNPPVILRPLDQAHLDNECAEAMDFAHSYYKRIFGSIYWRKDYSL
jgi:hypothetical protein